MNYKTLPKGYRRVEVMDFMRNRKQMTIVAVSGLAATVVMLAVGLLTKPFAPTWAWLRTNWWAWLVTPAMYVAYIPLHELTHGLPMHALSGVKPVYGLRFPYAYAGSRVWFDRRSHAFIALAPLVLWGIALFALGELLPGQWWWPLYIIQISNISGSAGDVYCVLHMSRLSKDIVIQDTGTRMLICAPVPTKNEEPK